MAEDIAASTEGESPEKKRDKDSGKPDASQEAKTPEPEKDEGQMPEKAEEQQPLDNIREGGNTLVFSEDERFRLTSDGRAFGIDDTGIWKVKKDMRNDELARIPELAGDEEAPSTARKILNTKANESAMDPDGMLILKEPIVMPDPEIIGKGDYNLRLVTIEKPKDDDKRTIVFNVVDGKPVGKPFEVKEEPKGNDKRITTLDEKGMPQRILGRTDLSLVLEGDADERHIDWTWPWIEHEAFRLYKRDKNPFSLLEKKKGQDIFERYIEFAINEFKVMISNRPRSELEAVLAQRNVSVDSMFLNGLRGLRSSELQNQLIRRMKEFYDLDPNEELFPHSRCAIRIALNKPTRQDEKERRYRDMAIRRIADPRLIRTLITSETTGERPVDVMELCKFIDCNKVYERLSFEGIIKKFVEFAELLRDLYKNKILHRDLKPGNMGITEDGRIKVFDFGTARIADAVSTKTQGKEVLTPNYASPEQIIGDSIAQGKAPLDIRADIYCLGMSFYEILTGINPAEAFGNVNPQVVCLKRAAGEQRLLSLAKCKRCYSGVETYEEGDGFFKRLEKRPKINERTRKLEMLESVLSCMLQHERSLRYGTVEIRVVPGKEGKSEIKGVFLNDSYECVIQDLKSIIEGDEPRNAAVLLGKLKGAYERGELYDGFAKMKIWEPGRYKGRIFVPQIKAVAGTQKVFKIDSEEAEDTNEE